MLVAGGVAWFVTRKPASPFDNVAETQAPSEQLLQQGEYVARLSDCVACHSTPKSAPFAGGLEMGTPLGSIFTTNITPDKETGIGNYTLADFDRAVRHGVARDGHRLYPAMPYPSYVKMSDDDIRALYAYFTKRVDPVRQADRPSDIKWPMNMRWPLALWNAVFTEPGTYQPKTAGDELWNRGAYLVQGPGHCGSCHTPRSLTMQEKALDESGPAYLAGGPVIDGWVAVNLRGNPADGLGAWSAADIVATLRAARNASHAVVGGPMNDAIVHSTQHLSDEDLNAVAAYLKTLGPSADSVSTFKADPATATALGQGVNATRGAELYADNCAGCHRSDGKGYAQVFPGIAGNSTVLSADPSSVIRLILQGSKLPATGTAPSELAMPGFGWRLSDDEVAQLASFVRQSWGNQAPAVDAARVGPIRKAVEKEMAAQSPAAR